MNAQRVRLCGHTGSSSVIKIFNTRAPLYYLNPFKHNYHHHTFVFQHVWKTEKHPATFRLVCGIFLITKYTKTPLEWKVVFFIVDHILNSAAECPGWWWGGGVRAACIFPRMLSLCGLCEFAFVRVSSLSSVKEFNHGSWKSQDATVKVFLLQVRNLVVVEEGQNAGACAASQSRRADSWSLSKPACTTADLNSLRAQF